MFTLLDGDNTISGTEQILKHTTSFYKLLFGPGYGNTFEMDDTLWPAEEKVTAIENAEINKTFQ
jgi:hypothetical protein